MKLEHDDIEASAEADIATTAANQPEGSAGTPSQALRDVLSRFRFDEQSTPSLRRSPRTINAASAREKYEESESSLPTLSAGGRSPKKRTGSTTDAPEVKRAKTPRGRVGIAPPEIYAHLDPLNDHLGHDPDMLDVMICGINPGKMSATVGHHFAHPTNHFWRCLHGAALTDRLVSPAEDATLPDNYRLGLTNIVERPSAQTAELADSEFTDGVPALLRKIVLKRPRVVCFVGKKIWESFVKVAAPSPQNGSNGRGSHEEESARAEILVGDTDAGSSTVGVSGKRAVSKKKAPARPAFTFDLQPYKIVHSDPNAHVRETLFFVVVSTSGLVAGYQLKEKIEQFTLLKKRVEELKSGTIDTSNMSVIPIPPDLL
ncbi:uracil-DNA glycosylase-like protein [Trametes polyzona]|nr:uracil-DNA glycosylase-like protein [Trametes polyzona]